MIKKLNSKFIRKFTAAAADELTGDWILVGGTLLPALGIDHRVTTDIELVPIRAAGNSSSLQLMALAEKHGLPVESVNPAAAYFLEKIADYRDSLVLLVEGKKARIFRPNGTLFLRMKMARMSESDLLDCLEWLKWAKREKEPLDLKKLRSELDRELKKEGEFSLRGKRLLTLRSHLGAR